MDKLNINEKVGDNLKDAGKAVGGFMKDFRAFAMKGNVIDMAVGVIIGGAFGKIVSSLVADIVMPLIGGLTGGFNFTDLVWHIADEKVVPNPVYQAAEAAGASLEGISATVTKPGVDLAYGQFIQNFVDFILIAFCIFLFVRLISKLQKKEEPAPAAPAPAPAKPDDVVLLEEIRDLLKEKK